MRSELEISSLTGRSYMDPEFLQCFTAHLHKRPIVTPRVAGDGFERDFAEPWFEEGNSYLKKL